MRVGWGGREERKSGVLDGYCLCRWRRLGMEASGCMEVLLMDYLER